MITVSPDVRSHLWAHFVFNAEQRLKAFNFFVVFSIFANGGIFFVIEKNLSLYFLVLVGVFMIVLSVVFFLIDVRSRGLVDLSKPGLKAYEEQLPAEYRVFSRDPYENHCFYRYTVAFRVLFGFQFVLGIVTVICGFMPSRNLFF